MSRAKEVAILNIGSHRITAVFAEKVNDRMFVVKGIGEAEYYGYDAASWYDGSEIANAVSLAIDRAEVQSGCRLKKTGFMYVALPSMFCMTIACRVGTEFNKPRKISAQDVSQLQLRANPFNCDMERIVIEKAVCYYELDSVKKVVEPIGLEAKTITALVSVIAAERKIMDFFNRIFLSMGIKSYRYINSTYAEMMYLFVPAIRDKRVIFADIGYLATTVAFMRGDGVQYMVSIPMGGAHIISDIAYYFGVDYEVGEKIFSKLDLTYGAEPVDTYSAGEDGIPDLPRLKVNEIVTSRLEDIARYVRRALDGSPIQYPPYLPLYISGDGITGIRGAKELLARKVGRNVEEAVPSTPGYGKPQYSAALGAVFYAFSAEENRGPFKKLNY